MKKEAGILSKLVKKKSALFSLIIIVLSCFVALFANLISTDKSPNANDQIPELALVKAGEKFKTLLLRKNKVIKSRGLIYKMFKGQENVYKTIPINNYTINTDSIILETYEGISEFGIQREGRKQAFHLVDLVYPVKQISPTSSGWNAEVLDGTVKQIDRRDLITKLEKENIQERRFYLGTDKFGRSIMSRLFLGIRISLLVGFIAVLISLTIGIFIGAVGAYYGKSIDQIVMLLINTVWSIPTLLLVFAIVLALGRGVGIIFFAVGLTMWVEVARIVRGQVKYYKESQFIEAARSMAFSNYRIIVKHILPNIIGPVLVIAAANFATAILIEAGLSYLGFGIRPPAPSIGNMLNENYGFALNGKPLLALIPALTIMLLVLAFNVLGNALRDIFDVKSD